MALLFVYGSLKRGFSNARQLSASRFVCEVQTARGYWLVRYEDGFPALYRGGSEAVQGELHELGESELLRLDEFEGCPELYQRQLIELGDGQLVFAYLIEPEVARAWPRANSGDFREEP